MTSDKIKQIAICHFARNGYEGASLGQIAAEVGIKKQSIYNHFKGKDELFLQICRDSNVYVIYTVKKYMEINRNLPFKQFLYNLLLVLKDQFEKNEFTRFCLRFSLFPPSHLYEQVKEIVYHYLYMFEALLISVFEVSKLEGQIHTEVYLEEATSAYLGLLDGIFIEMLYGEPSRIQKRLNHSWTIYWRGITK
ncbi:TetR/AcrR family transcriptional regulator [Niallia circulans]|uniref:TetR/AcrR family transcriptional regulator n=1 Tax=Niallia circulans TaxID=1397 RepID=A0A553SRG7_NIACI|nr:TetR/AcrR family transcriptional regulator [Niallia circulans]TRZ39576.1 TetR/AcrR family transcriptional regulator [Niallia circulans]